MSLLIFYGNIAYGWKDLTYEFNAALTFLDC